MAKQFTTSTTYFLQEGKENLLRTMRLAFRAAVMHRIEKLIIFTAQGQGIKLAIEDFLPMPEYQDIKLIAVTFPRGKNFTDKDDKHVPVEISPEDVNSFLKCGIPTIKAHLPFDPIASRFTDRGPLAQSLSLVSDALNIFGGSMSLCVQAVILACDAGAVQLGEHVVSMASDCAILAQATSTTRMLKDLIVREIICKPAILSVSRGEKGAAALPSRTAHRRALAAKKNDQQ